MELQTFARDMIKEARATKKVKADTKSFAS